MNQQLKAIETKFDGHRFRSRTEARWAVFFKTAQIEYQYEPEGFEFPSDGGVLRYLPDFWLPKYKLWFEVKGAAFDDVTKQVLLCKKSDCHVLVATGTPRLDEPQLYYINPDYIAYEEAEFFPSPVFSDYLGVNIKLMFGESDAGNLCLYPSYTRDRGILLGSIIPSVLKTAFEAAGYARFEHGECGYNQRSSPELGQMHAP